MKRPRVSIILPALNEADALPATLRALAPGRAGGAEVIVVDGGSADETRALAEAGADRVLAGPRGRARQLNAGAGMATGEVLWFLHADTLAPADALDQIASGLARGRRWGRFDLRLSGRRRWSLRVVEQGINLRSRLQGLGTGDQGLFVERSLFEALGGFPDQPLMEDLELALRLRRRAGRPACPRGPLVTSSRRWETHGVLRTVFLMWRLRAAYALGADPRHLHRRYHGPDVDTGAGAREHAGQR